MAARANGTEAFTGTALAMTFLPRERGAQRCEKRGARQKAWLQNPPAAVHPEPFARSDLPIWFVRILVLRANTVPAEPSASVFNQRVQLGQAKMYVPAVFTQRSSHILWNPLRATTTSGASTVLIALARRPGIYEPIQEKGPTPLPPQNHAAALRASTTPPACENKRQTRRFSPSTHPLRCRTR